MPWAYHAGMRVLTGIRTGFVGFLWGIACLAALAQPSDAPRSLTPAQIVDQLQKHNQLRTDGLKQYKTLRRYSVDYHGLTKLEAQMDVEVTYDAATGKSFRIIAQSGSNLLYEKVLKRAVESEKEAAQDKTSTALTEKNYRFHLAGIEQVANRPAYILSVEPITASKFLVRGKVWVDAADFAVVKMETEPAKSPSFWISRTLISSTCVRAGGFWLPEKLRSETKVRLGGGAVLTIDYGNYEIVPQVGFQNAGR